MGRGRKKLPTEVKKLRGTLKKERVLENEMQVEILKELPETPEWLSDIAKVEWKKVCLELFNKNMLHYVDLKLIEAYCNAIALHIGTEMLLRVLMSCDLQLLHIFIWIQEEGQGKKN